MAFQPVIGGAFTVFFQGFLIFGFLSVKQCTEPQHRMDTPCLWAVGVFWRFAFGVVFAVDGDPFPCDHASG